jgi:flagellar biogenesis protein FliO
MRKTSAVLTLCFLLLLSTLCIAANNNAVPTSKNSTASSQEFQDRGAGYLPYSDPSPLGKGGFFGAIVRAMFSLVVVLTLLYAALWVIKKMTASTMGIPSEGLLRVVGRIYLNPKVIIYFVKIVDKLLVVGVNSGNISLLTTIDDEHEIVQIESALRSAQTNVPGMVFSRFFDKSLSRFQKALEKDNSAFDNQLRVLNDQIGRLRGLTRKKHKDEN